jgi:hypothetical protein
MSVQRAFETASAANRQILTLTAKPTGMLGPMRPACDNGDQIIEKTTNNCKTRPLFLSHFFSLQQIDNML